MFTVLLLPCFQYYATVQQDAEDNIVWLSKANIEERAEPAPGTSGGGGCREGIIGIADMVGSGQSVGAVVSDTVDGLDSVSYASTDYGWLIKK